MSDLGAYLEAAARARQAADQHPVTVVLQPDGRNRIELLNDEGQAIARTFARDPKIAFALAGIYREKGIDAADGCPCCEVLVV